jgi:REP element-mobilizing transposase RayT
MPTFKNEKDRQNYERLKKNPLVYGGRLRNTRYGRSRPRPLSNRQSMHLILKSSKAKGAYCLREGDRGRNFHKIQRILDKFSRKYRVKIHRRANVGNHLHLHVELADLASYNPFIRAITAAIAMAVTKSSRWKKGRGKFWDLRPFTHLVATKLGFQRVNRYIKINQYEPVFGRRQAELIVSGKAPAYG